MSETLVRNVTRYALALSVLVTIWSMGRSSEWSFDIGALLFILWTLSPYVFVFSAELLSRKIPAVPEIPLVFCILSILMLGLTYYDYITAMNGESSTEALVYVFVPIYLYFGSVVILTVSFIIAFFVKRSRRRKA